MLKSFVQLTVSFAVESDDFCYERTPMPDELIRGVSGKLVYEQTAFRVSPIQGYKVNFGLSLSMKFYRLLLLQRVIKYSLFR